MIFHGVEAVEIASKSLPGSWRVDDTISIVHAVADEVSSVCILNKFEEHSVELTFAHVNKLSNISEFIREIFNEIFIHQGKKVAVMITSVENKRMILLHKKLGHTFSGIIPFRFGDADGFIFTIVREEAERLWLQRFCK